MATPRYLFGSGASDFAIAPPSRHGGFVVSAASLGNGTLWSASTGGTKYTDLQTVNGGAVTFVSTDKDGSLIPFYGPAGIDEGWLDFGGGSRSFISANHGQDRHVAALFNDDASASAVALDARNQAKGDARYSKRGDIMLSINDYSPNPTAIASVLDQALADAATKQRIVNISAGQWTTAKAGRHVIKSQSGLIGDPSGGTVLNFTNAAGGLEISDGAGGAAYTYRNTVADMLLDGQGIATDLVKIIKSSESSVRRIAVQNYLGAAVDMSDSSIVIVDHLVVTGIPSSALSRQTVGLRLNGTTGQVIVKDANFWRTYQPILVTGTSLAHLRMTDSWVEQCNDIVILDPLTGVLSIGTIDISGTHMIVPSSGTVPTWLDATKLQLVRALTPRVGSGYAIPGNMIRANGVDLSGAAATSPLIDFTAFNNSAATLALNLEDVAYKPAAGLTSLIAANASQNANNLKARVLNAPFVTSDRWYNQIGGTGGVDGEMPRLSGYFAPEATVTAGIGTLYVRTFNGEHYIKTTATGNTGWKQVTHAA